MRTVICGQHHSIAAGVLVDDCKECQKKAREKAELEEKHRLCELELKEAARTYLEAYVEYDLATAEIGRLQGIIKACSESMDRTHAVLAKAVQPICGSATQPHRRLYQFNSIPGITGKVLVINHDHGNRGPVVSVEEVL